RPLARLGWLRLILVIASLWLFSIIAGGQPSVLRSAVMFTFLATARATDRKTNIFNTLAMSAFVLLAWNPLWLWDAGFQLSYGALVGILVFYQPLSRWLLFSNRMLVFLWQLVAVTLTAQVFTLPISIFWFHQVPLLFMLSNIVAVPLSGIILMGEIFFCIISFVPLLAEAVAGLLQFMIRLMNGYVERIDSISFSVWQDLYLPLPAVLLLGVLFCSFCMWVMWRQHGWVYIGLLSLAAMTGILRSRIHAQLSQSRIIVYNLPGRSMTDLVLSRSAYTYPDHATGNDAFMLKMHIAPSRLMHGITGTQVMHAGVYHAGPATIAVLDSTNAGRVFKLSKVDLLIVTGKKTRDSETILSRVRPGFVVADGSMPEWAAIHWKRACSARKVPFHHVLTDGCYARDLTSLR
ncbi:MAG TPA: ComEC/Rec2 family competence protein, partial [Flavisolibacter sp.]